MALVMITDDHAISNVGIRSIKQAETGEIQVRYLSGFTETVENMSMTELLTKLGRLPSRRGTADSG